MSTGNTKMDTVEGGPFTNAELSQLSLLHADGWREVEGDTLVTLTGMLQIHVGSGVGIDLVGEGRNVVMCNKEGGGPVISVQQVRHLFIATMILLIVGRREYLLPCVLEFQLTLLFSNCHCCAKFNTVDAGTQILGTQLCPPGLSRRIQTRARWRLPSFTNSIAKFRSSQYFIGDYEL